MRSLTLAALLGAALVLASGRAAAIGIGEIKTENRSSSNFSRDVDHGAQEFRSRASFTEPVRQGNVVSFTHRLAWFAGAADLGYFQPAEATIAYSFVFTVDDPQERGYRLDLDGRLRGLLYGQSNANSSYALRMPGLKVMAFAAFEPEAIEPPELATRTWIESGASGIIVDSPLDESGRATLGHWSGTRSFLISMTTASPGDMLWAQTSAGPDGDALSYLQFGARPLHPKLVGGYYTGSGSPDLEELGHFLTVRAVFAAPVPEPGTWALLGSGLGLLLWRRARRGSGGAS